MGSRIAPLLAILTMNYLEQNFIFSDYCFIKPLVFLRYMDNILAIVKNKDEATHLFNFLNHINPDIQFEIELPNYDNRLNPLGFSGTCVPHLRFSLSVAQYRTYFLFKLIYYDD